MIYIILVAGHAFLLEEEIKVGTIMIYIILVAGHAFLLEEEIKVSTIMICIFWRRNSR